MSAGAVPAAGPCPPRADRAAVPLAWPEDNFDPSRLLQRGPKQRSETIPKQMTGAEEERVLQNPAAPLSPQQGTTRVGHPSRTTGTGAMAAGWPAALTARLVRRSQSTCPDSSSVA